MTMHRHAPLRTAAAFLTGMGAGVAHTFLRPLIAEAAGHHPPALLHDPPALRHLARRLPAAQGAAAGAGYPITPILEVLRGAAPARWWSPAGVDGPPNNTQNGDRHGARPDRPGDRAAGVQPANASADDRADSNSKTITAATPSFDQYLLQNGDPGRAAGRPARPSRSTSRATPARGRASTSPACRPSATPAPASPSSASRAPCGTSPTSWATPWWGPGVPVDPAVLERQLHAEEERARLRARRSRAASRPGARVAEREAGRPPRGHPPARVDDHAARRRR